MTVRNRYGLGRRSLRRALGGLGFAAALLSAAGVPGQETPAPPAVAGQAAAAPADAEEKLRRQQEKTRAELDAIARSMTLSQEKVTSLRDNINALQQTSAALKTKVIESAARRRHLEDKIAAGEKTLTALEIKRGTIRDSLHERRALLAEVLAALQRMGRNPPPALLVSPDDALASVRSAILLGAVVPGMRHQTEALLADLTSLGKLKADIEAEKAAVTGDMANRMEEERRMDLLISRNEALSQQNTADLAAEQQKAAELAAKAQDMDELIASLETDIASAHEAAEAAREAEEQRSRMSEAEKEKARELALANPNQNRMTPAIPFSEMKGKLGLPVAGDVVRRFGEDDGTGHPARGVTVAAGTGALVTAPVDGHVVYAGPFRSYGQMIILNTGEGFHVVLTGMDAVKTAQGKFVLQGEPLAVMGEKRVASATALALETDRPTLYIEFRKDGKPVDSQPWWTAKDIGKAHNDT